MANHIWDLKSNYMLAFTVCKYGLNPEQWHLIANDLADYINTTPQKCQAQFNRLCEQYGRDGQNASIDEPLHTHIFTIIKRLYYGDLCERMTESRALLKVMYDFIRLFKSGRITSNDINEILQDIKNTTPTDNNTHDNERQRKIKMLGRLKLHMTQQNSQTSDSQSSSFPVELLPPPPFFQQQSQPIIPNYISQEQIVSTTNDNDRQVPSFNGYLKSNATEISSFPIIIQSNNLLIENERQFININNNNQSNEVDIDEIELSSDDDDINDRTTTTAQMSNYDEPSTTSNLINDQDESTFISDEQMETNQSSDIPPITTEISNSNDRDLYETVSGTSISNQSTFDTRLSDEERVTSSTSGQPISLNLQLNVSISGSSDYITSDNDQIQSIQNHHHPIDVESIITTTQHIPLVDDEVARMDAEQIPEPIPADVSDVSIPNDNAMFVVDELVSTTNIPTISKNHTDEQSIMSNVTLRSEHDESTNTTNLRRQSRSTTSSTSNNHRKSINSVLNNLKTAKYGYDFAKPLTSFQLPDEYYHRIKQPLDIPEIRERMNNGHYDDNILFFERDILLMFTNALSVYHRDVDIHEHARYMINYTMELFASMKDVVIPWKNENNGDVSSIFHHDSDDNTLNSSSITRTSSITSISSSIRTNSSTKQTRSQATSNHSMSKRQRKTTH